MVSNKELVQDQQSAFSLIIPKRSETKLPQGSLGLELLGGVSVIENAAKAAAAARETQHPTVAAGVYGERVRKLITDGIGDPTFLGQTIAKRMESFLATK